MNRPIPFVFTDIEQGYKVVSLLRKQAEAFRLLASRLTGDDALKFEEQAREAICHRLSHRTGGERGTIETAGRSTRPRWRG
jgi:hypothetical protein